MLLNIFNKVLRELSGRLLESCYNLNYFFSAFRLWILSLLMFSSFPVNIQVATNVVVQCDVGRISPTHLYCVIFCSKVGPSGIRKSTVEVEARWH